MDNLIDAKIEIDLELIDHDEYLWLVDTIELMVSKISGGSETVEHEILTKYGVTND